MGDGIGIPTFGEHGDGDNAADLSAQLAVLADRIHHLAQQLLVGDGIAGAGVTRPFDQVAAEAFDFFGGEVAEIFIERVLALQLFAVDQKRVGFGEWIAVVVEVAEEVEAARDEFGLVVLELAVEARDIIVDEFRDGGILADDDEAGGNRDTGLFPLAECFFVVPVERFHGGLEADG